MHERPDLKQRHSRKPFFPYLQSIMDGWRGRQLASPRSKIFSKTFGDERRIAITRSLNEKDFALYREMEPLSASWTLAILSGSVHAANGSFTDDAAAASGARSKAPPLHHPCRSD